MSEMPPLALALSQLNIPDAMSIVSQKINDGVPAPDIVNECHIGMTDLGRRFDEGDCFVPELVVAGKIMEKIMTQLEPLLEGSDQNKDSVGKVVMGTVQNDVHDIGKDIVVMMLRGSGFEVIDLGINVPPEKFVEAIKENNPSVVGMSVLLTTCYKSIIDTIQAIKDAGQRDKISIMLGGAAATEMLADKTGCDYYGKTAVDAVSHASLVAQSN